MSCYTETDVTQEVVQTDAQEIVQTNAQGVVQTTTPPCGITAFAHEFSEEYVKYAEARTFPGMGALRRYR